MNKVEAKKYKDYPEGSGGKKTYDMFYLTFQDYLNKYYSNSDLSRWDYINHKFVLPLFDGTKWEDYWSSLSQAKPKFVPNESKKNEFWVQIKDDTRFSLELKHFFTFLYSINFYRDFLFEEWLKASNWIHPWYKDASENDKPIIELLDYNYSENFIKSKLAVLTIF